MPRVSQRNSSALWQRGEVCLPKVTMTLADRITTLRKQRGYSQRQLAGALGVSRGAVGHWECGRKYPTVAKLEELASVLEVDATVLFSAATWPAHDPAPAPEPADLDPELKELLALWYGMPTRTRRNLLKICRKNLEIRMQRSVSALHQASDAA